MEHIKSTKSPIRWYLISLSLVIYFKKSTIDKSTSLDKFPLDASEMRFLLTVTSVLLETTARVPAAAYTMKCSLTSLLIILDDTFSSLQLFDKMTDQLTYTSMYFYG